MLIAELVGGIKDLSIPEESKSYLLSLCDQVEKEMDQVKSLSEYDVLGDWLNRRGLFKRADTIFSEYYRNTYTVVSVVYIDLDYFKSINDTYGHKYGDMIIAMVADAISSSIRRIDAFGRLSGDEFVIILPGSKEEEATEAVMRIREKYCSMQFSFNTKQIPLSFSFGVVSTETANRKTFDDLLHDADNIMKPTKETGQGNKPYCHRRP